MPHHRNPSPSPNPTQPLTISSSASPSISLPPSFPPSLQVCFTIYYVLPFAFDCSPCPTGAACHPDGSSSSYTSSSSSSSSSEQHADGTVSGLSSLEYVRFNCAAHEHNEMATLMQSGQEGILKHLYMRSGGASEGGIDGGFEPTLACCATLLAVYFVLAFSLFGVGLPAGRRCPLTTSSSPLAT